MTEHTLTATSMAASLTVRDVNASLAWYEGVLGFTVARRHEREGKMLAASLRAGDVQVLLVQDDGAKGLDRVKGIGFSMQLTTTMDIDALAAAMQSRGAVLEGPVVEVQGARAFRLVDPDGFKFVFSSPR